MDKTLPVLATGKLTSYLHLLSVSPAPGAVMRTHETGHEYELVRQRTVTLSLELLALQSW
ncbi:hypothetical protein BD309DRAFT_533595 [Dichomitus squalens]|uniref:Uncharacterized protein n=2 Tax=Dichomitus squalens TaxID=114155 RepID=A0A4V2K8P3_9APHY|nr:uncharacterized protein DICSQDRAFT_140841 [Dichomitus squalens LYAD-421 SS1]EJF56905.1 hypothetical protein DICSQDRAFT_140841 [Dichomitus squalens LYAD-421 SS1]TBU47100.1 hypothetical protein BD309DRAFT_533595 [Dichomitus squalens]TBU60768.1 hypothetical protein BD310DRAFT_947050 [Dichomitus squalens]